MGLNYLRTIRLRRDLDYISSLVRFLKFGIFVDLWRVLDTKYHLIQLEANQIGLGILSKEGKMGFALIRSELLDLISKKHCQIMNN